MALGNLIVNGAVAVNTTVIGDTIKKALDEYEKCC